VLAACAPLPPPEEGGEGTLAGAFARGTLVPRVSAGRPDAAGLSLHVHWATGRTYVLEVARDAQGRESRRLTARDASGQVAWRREPAPGLWYTDVAVHPSGELTVGVEDRGAARNAFALLRLSADADVLGEQPLAAPATLPPGDVRAPLPPAPFAMLGVPGGALVAGWRPWLQLEARGEGVVAAVLSQTLRADGSASGSGLVSAVVALGWREGAYREEWARVVDGAQSLVNISWIYDDFLWLDAATRLLLAVGPGGEVVVGRTLPGDRCQSLEDFGEMTDAACRRLGNRNSEHRYQPFAFTRFSAAGERLGSGVLAPEGLEEFVVFDMALGEGGRLAVAGSAVKQGPELDPLYYFEPSDPHRTPLMPYDGYLAVLSLQGAEVLREAWVDLGRGELLSAVRWTEEGLLAAGGADWDRWHGGMSLSRGADPLLVLLPHAGGEARVRRLQVDALHRHATLLGVEALGGGVVSAVGLFDAPMTHSGDGGRREEMTFGGLQLELR
jgi:hypothetical protein